MLKLSKILLPVDFSEPALGAARYAGALARQFNSELTLLHVNSLSIVPPLESSEQGDSLNPAWIAALEAQRRKELDSYRRIDFRDVNVERVVVTGDPATEIVAYAKRQKTGLIVMSTHGYGPFRRYLLGSVTAKVLNDAACPVWTGVHMRDTSQHQWKVMNRILCAVDGGPASERILDWACQFASEFGSLVTLVHAIPRLDAPDEVVDPEWRRGRIKAVESQLGCLQKKIGAPVDVFVEEGVPSKVVASAVDALHADLVVIGRSPAGEFLGRLRPNAYAIVSDSPCPVVSL